MRRWSLLAALTALALMAGCTEDIPEDEQERIEEPNVEPIEGGPAVDDEADEDPEESREPADQQNGSVQS